MILNMYIYISTICIYNIHIHIYIYIYICMCKICVYVYIYIIRSSIFKKNKFKTEPRPVAVHQFTNSWCCSSSWSNKQQEESFSGFTRAKNSVIDLYSWIKQLIELIGLSTIISFSSQALVLSYSWMNSEKLFMDELRLKRTLGWVVL